MEDRREMIVSNEYINDVILLESYNTHETLLPIVKKIDELLNNSTMYKIMTESEPEFGNLVGIFSQIMYEFRPTFETFFSKEEINNSKFLTLIWRNE